MTGTVSIGTTAEVGLPTIHRGTEENTRPVIFRLQTAYVPLNL